MLSIAAGLALLSLAQKDGLTLTFSPVGESIYYETFRITETGSDNQSRSAEADRTMVYRVTEIKKGRARMEVNYTDIKTRAANDAKGLAENLRSWIDLPTFEQIVNERGYVERKDEVRGNRPFFALVLPPPAGTMPDTWNAKLLTPIGSERSADFRFRFEDIDMNGDPTLRISLSASDKFDKTQVDVSGRVLVTRSGEIRNGEVKTTILDGDNKTTTVIEYRFRRK